MPVERITQGVRRDGLDRLCNGSNILEYDVCAECTENYDEIVLDLGLPRLDAPSFKKLRSAGIVTPILILTARGSWMEQVEGINTGADDYLPKPFHREALLVRLAAITRRCATASPTDRANSPTSAVRRR